MDSRDYSPDAAFAKAADDADPLREFGTRFHFPNPPARARAIYFTGNSLGLQPKTTRSYIEQELDDWATLAVDGHFRARNPWLPYHEFLTEQMARVVGARPIETVVMNSLTVNLHLMMVSFYRPAGKRTKIVIEKGAFPSDQYAVESQLRFHLSNKLQFVDGGPQTSPKEPDPAVSRAGDVGPNPTGNKLQFVEQDLIELAPSEGESTLRTEDIIETIERHGEEIALVMLGGVNYYTGQAFDMRAIAEAGRRVGAIVGFDLAHAAGNLELKLHDWNVDFAVWCSYKYLNAGPGGVAGAFVHERHAEAFDLPRFAGWWGHDKNTRFLMGPEFRPIPGAEGWQISNPPIFQMAALRASLEIFDEAGMPNLRAKSEKLTGYLEYLLTQIGDDRISVITPTDPMQRGCQLSIRVRNDGRDLFETLTDRGVFVDWRQPDVIRAAPVPLYNSFSDVYSFVEILKDSLDSIR